MTDQNPIGEGVLHADIVLTIIVSCYNDRDLARGFPRSIYRSPPTEPYEIILVDNASSDGTSEMVVSATSGGSAPAKRRQPPLYIFEQQGARSSFGTYVLLLNSDTIVLPQALDLMIDFLRKRPKLARSAANC